MKNVFYGNAVMRILVSIAVLPAAGFFGSCATEKPQAAPPQQEEVYLFDVRSPQDYVYSGKPQAISYIFTGDIKPDIVYYTSPRDRAEDRRGSRTDPVDAGTYYVRLIRPGKGKNVPAKEFFAVMNILKRQVKIDAEKTQTAIFDGNPKRITAVVDPAVPLSYSYYPNLELMEAAKKSSAENPPGQSTITQTFRGYRRVDRAPNEQGSYYVWIYYPGDDNHTSASVDVMFTILPP